MGPQLEAQRFHRITVPTPKLAVGKKYAEEALEAAK